MLQENIYDNKLALQLAGQKQDLANEILINLKNTLPENIRNIKIIIKQKNIIELKQQIHKLHGFICYCGVPRFKKAIAELDASLKNDTSLSNNKITNLIENFITESSTLISFLEQT